MSKIRQQYTSFHWLIVVDRLKNFTFRFNYINFSDYNDTMVRITVCNNSILD